MTSRGLKRRAGRLIAGLFVAIATLGGGLACDETYYSAAYDEYSGGGDYVDTLLGNFVDYGDGVPWTFE